MNTRFLIAVVIVAALLLPASYHGKATAQDPGAIVIPIGPERTETPNYTVEKISDEEGALHGGSTADNQLVMLGIVFTTLLLIAVVFSPETYYRKSIK